MSGLKGGGAVNFVAVGGVTDEVELFAVSGAFYGCPAGFGSAELEALTGLELVDAGIEGHGCWSNFWLCVF